MAAYPRLHAARLETQDRPGAKGVSREEMSFTAIDLLSALADAHGGYSQFGEAQVGFSIYGHFANSGNLVGSYATADEAISAAAAELAEMWADCGVEYELARAAIAAGYRAAHSRRVTDVDNVALGAITGGLPVRFVTALWDGQGVPDGAVGTMLAGRVEGRHVYGVGSGQQLPDGADEVEGYEVWPLRLDARQMLR